MYYLTPSIFDWLSPNWCKIYISRTSPLNLKMSVTFFWIMFFFIRWMSDRMVVGSITTNIVISNPVHDEVYSIQQYMVKFVCDLRQIGGFLRELWFSPPIKPWYNWNIVESGIKYHNPTPIIKYSSYLKNCF